MQQIKEWFLDAEGNRCEQWSPINDAERSETLQRFINVVPRMILSHECLGLEKVYTDGLSWSNPRWASDHEGESEVGEPDPGKGASKREGRNSPNQSQDSPWTIINFQPKGDQGTRQEELRRIIRVAAMVTNTPKEGKWTQMQGLSSIIIKELSEYKDEEPDKIWAVYIGGKPQ